MAEYELRAATPNDFEDILALNEAAYRRYVEKVYGWDDAFQREYLAGHVDYPNTKMILVGGETIGFVAVKPQPDCAFLASIALAQEFRSRGFGTRIIEGVVAEARSRGLPVRLQVFRDNVKAQALYIRLGFEPEGETETHLKFVRRL
jgi:ribosomal protein S18 acetylase RimI-like enzyme